MSNNQLFGYISDAYVPQSSISITESNEVIGHDQNDEPIQEKFMILEGEFTRSEHLNKQKRYYPDYIIERETEKLKNQVNQQNGIPSQLDHPIPSNTEEGMVRVQRNFLESACGIINHLEKQGNVVYGKLKVLNHGPKGEQLKGILSTKFKVGISSRAIGGQPIAEGDALRVPDNITFITFDVVSNPSNHSSILEQTINEEMDYFNELNKVKNGKGKKKSMVTVLENYFK